MNNEKLNQFGELNLNYNFQFPASEHAQALVDFFFYISFFLIIILVFVVWMLRFVLNYIVVNNIYFLEDEFTMFFFIRNFFISLFRMIRYAAFHLSSETLSNFYFNSVWIRANFHERKYVRFFTCLHYVNTNFNKYAFLKLLAKNQFFAFIQGVYRNFHNVIITDFPHLLALVTTWFIMFEEVLILIDKFSVLFFWYLKKLLWEHQFWFDFLKSNVRFFNFTDFFTYIFYGFFQIQHFLYQLFYIFKINFYLIKNKYSKNNSILHNLIIFRNLSVWLSEYFVTNSVYERCITCASYNDRMRVEEIEDYSVTYNGIRYLKFLFSDNNLLFRSFFSRFGYNHVDAANDFLILTRDIHQLRKYFIRKLKVNKNNKSNYFFWLKTICLFSLRNDEFGDEFDLSRLSLIVTKMEYLFGLELDEFRILYFFFLYNSLIWKRSWYLINNNVKSLYLLFDNKINSVLINNKGKLSTSKGYFEADFCYNNIFEDYSVFLKVPQIESVLRQQQFRHSVALEIIWTVIPIIILIFILYPSMLLLYSYDRPYVTEPYITFKAIGHQWFWSYEFSDFNFLFDKIKFVNVNLSDYNKDDKLGVEDKSHVIKIFNFFNFFLENFFIKNFNCISKLAFDSYMVHEDELEFGGFRLLEVDNRVVLPTGICVRVLTSSVDVIHCWAVPSLGLRIDSIPGRLNQQYMVGNKPGIYYGQCSELCGVGHGFMPIMVELVSPLEYLHYTNSLVLNNLKDIL